MKLKVGAMRKCGRRAWLPEENHVQRAGVDKSLAEGAVVGKAVGKAVTYNMFSLVRARSLGSIEGAEISK